MPNKKHAEERVNPLFANTTRREEPQKTTPPPPPPPEAATPAVHPPETEKKAPQTKPNNRTRRTPASKPTELPSAGVRHRRVGPIPFKEAYKQFTSFLDIELDKRFHALLAEQGVTKTELFNEAIIDLLKKYKKYK